MICLPNRPLGPELYVRMTYARYLMFAGSIQSPLLGIVTFYSAHSSAATGYASGSHFTSEEWSTVNHYLLLSLEEQMAH